MKKIIAKIKNRVKYKNILIISIVFMFTISSKVFAESDLVMPDIGVDIGTSNDPKDVSTSIQVILLLTVLSIAPSILIMMTSFTRIIIVLSFMRNALGTQQMPPNQVLLGLAMFLTFFIMSPVGSEINKEALKPYNEEKITQEEALKNTSVIIKKFMFKHTRKKDLSLFIKLSNTDKSLKKNEIPLTTVIPAFLISELKTAFQIGFLIFIPFLIIDMVVASVLMSMGMMMLPPVMISLPFKILLFILIDGWNLITQSIVGSFIK